MLFFFSFYFIINVPCVSTRICCLLGDFYLSAKIYVVYVKVFIFYFHWGFLFEHLCCKVHECSLGGGFYFCAVRSIVKNFIGFLRYNGNKKSGYTSEL